MKKILKTVALSLAFVILTGCSNKAGGGNQPQNEISPSPSAGVTEENGNQGTGGNDQEGNQTATGPEGDLAEDIILALDAGHGGGFGGASYDGRNEKDLTLTMAFYVKEYLEENYSGIQIYLVRDKDTALSGDVKEDLVLRAQYAEDVNADAYVSLHFNSTEEHNQTGAMVFISHQESVTDASKALSESILAELEALGLTNHGVKTRNSNDMFDESGKALDYYAINRHTAAREIPGIIVEHCFMDVKSDQAFIDSDEDLRAMAKADAIGIANYYGLAKR